ncbi:MAG: hypothetical protein LBH80_03045 [Prevotellaceae bacterium]|jgi:hypothetical protein|nr:hypothetical protein [Prevotellaceae bacterium]
MSYKTNRNGEFKCIENINVGCIGINIDSKASLLSTDSREVVIFQTFAEKYHSGQYHTSQTQEKVGVNSSRKEINRIMKIPKCVTVELCKVNNRTYFFFSRKSTSRQL